MNTAKQRIRRASANRRRSAFREEFYKDSDRQRPSARGNKGGAGGRGRRVPLWAAAGGFGLLFCVIAIGGSSAMIWLRKLGGLFGVYWIGD